MAQVEPHFDDNPDPDEKLPVSPPSPRSALFWDGWHWRVPRVDDNGRVQVRGEDQLFSFDRPYNERVPEGPVAAGDHLLLGTQVAAGEIWVVTNVAAFDALSTTTMTEIDMQTNGAARRLISAVPPAAGVSINWQGWLPLDEDDRIAALFVGCTLNDFLYLDICGFVMTLET